MIDAGEAVSCSEENGENSRHQPWRAAVYKFVEETLRLVVPCAVATFEEAPPPGIGENDASHLGFLLSERERTTRAKQVEHAEETA